MAIKNFIEFATDKIHPDVFNEYRLNHYEDGDFTGADESTLDFTKLGWLMSVREDMRRKNTLTDSVDELINGLFSEEHRDEGGVSSNYRTLSHGNYNLLQQIVFDNRTNESFDLDYSYIDDFSASVNDLLYARFDANQMSAAEMIIEFGLHNAVSKLSIYNLGAESTDSLASKRFSIYLYAYQKAASEFVSIPDGTGKAAKTLNAVRRLVDEELVTHYESFYFKNAISQSSATYPKNELSRMFSFLSHDLLEEYAPKIIDDLLGEGHGAVYGNPVFPAALKVAVRDSSGLGATQVRFDEESYLARVEGIVTDVGYSPLYFYINRYKTECRISILRTLSKAFSPLAVAVGTSLKDGFTPLSLLSSYLTIGDDNSWDNQEIVSFIKSVISPFASVDNPFEVFAALGSVRDFTGGKTNNMFGTVNNIFSTINNKHKSWWATESADEDSVATIDDFKPTFDSLSSDIFSGEALSYSNYKIWMFENGKEVS